MSEKQQREIFAKNLNYYINKYEKTQLEIAEKIGVSPQTFNTWCRGIAIPRMGKVQSLADYFHIEKSDLIDEKTERTEDDLLDAIASRYGQDCAEAIEIYLKFHGDERQKLNSLLAEYYKLDEIDRAEVRGRIMQFVENMLDSDKYSAQEGLKHA